MTDEYAPLVSPKTRDARPARRCITCCVVGTLALVALRGLVKEVDADAWMYSQPRHAMR